MIEELLRSDLIVIGAPMYSFGIPSTLKAWFDHVIRPGRTFTYAGGAPQALIKGKRASSSSKAAAAGTPTARRRPPISRTFIGLTDVGREEHRAQALAQAKHAIHSAVSGLQAAA